jgi:ABC-2 type transport system permease protein
MTSVAARDRRAAAPAVHRRPPGRWRSLRAVIGGELRAQRRAPLSWGLGLGAMTALMAAMWPSIEGSMEEMMESYPASIKEAFGIQALDTVEKYVDAEMLSLVIPLALGFFVVRRMAGALTGAEERGHLDPLLSLPLARWVLVAGTFVATGVMTAVILVVIWALTLLVGTIAGTGISALTLGEGLLSVWPLVMVFGGLATLAAGLLHHAAAVTAIGAGTLVGMYVVDLVGKLAEPLEPLRAATAFRYYGSAIQQGLDVSHLLGLTLVALLLAALGAWRFERRDVL